jgi:hypothetical protein
VHSRAELVNKLMREKGTGAYLAAIKP